MKRTVPVILATLSGFILVIIFMLNKDSVLFGATTVNDVHARLLQWVTIIGGFTLLLGVVSILRVNMRAFQQNKKDRWYKLATIISLLAIGIPGAFPNAGTEFGNIVYSFLPNWAPVYMGTQPGIIYNWLFDNIDAPMMATMFATLAFYIASAAYRAFRARNTAATLMLLSAVIVMFWRVPLGEQALMSISDQLPEMINGFLMRGVNGAVQRAILIGAALGAASMSLRILLGIERTYMGKS